MITSVARYQCYDFLISFPVDEVKKFGEIKVEKL